MWGEVDSSDVSQVFDKQLCNFPKISHKTLILSNIIYEFICAITVQLASKSSKIFDAMPYKSCTRQVVVSQIERKSSFDHYFLSSIC